MWLQYQKLGAKYNCSIRKYDISPILFPHRCDVSLGAYLLLAVCAA